MPVFFKAYGLADREKKIANTIRTRFNLGSINKAFTQVAIHQLVAAGKLSYSDTIGKFYPDYPQAASRSATVEQLLGHRAGLSDFFGAEFTRAPKSQFASNADYFTIRRQPAAGLRARRARAILQRLLHRPRRHRREGVGDAV